MGIFIHFFDFKSIQRSKTRDKDLISLKRGSYYHGTLQAVFAPFKQKIWYINTKENEELRRQTKKRRQGQQNTGSFEVNHLYFSSHITYYYLLSTTIKNIFSENLFLVPSFRRWYSLKDSYSSSHWEVPLQDQTKTLVKTPKPQNPKTPYHNQIIEF